MNAYFGGTLCTADVNRDGVDDLLVGAMLYSPSLLGGGQLEDVGAVFLYLGPFNVCLWQFLHCHITLADPGGAHLATLPLFIPQTL